MIIPQTLWFTGLSGAGKTTLSSQIQSICEKKGIQSIILDGDVLRTGLCADLGFTNEDRIENIRRTIEVAKLFLAQGYIVIVATISPFKAMRERARAELSPLGLFTEVYCNASYSTCELRDVKGLYKEAREGQHKQFTGLGSQYEPPVSPEITIDSSTMTIDESVFKILKHVNLLHVAA